MNRPTGSPKPTCACSSRPAARGACGRPTAGTTRTGPALRRTALQQLVEQRHRAPVAPEPTESLEAQLEASIRTPPVGRMVRAALLTLGLSLVPLAGWATMTTMERAVIAT